MTVSTFIPPNYESELDQLVKEILELVDGDNDTEEVPSDGQENGVVVVEEDQRHKKKGEEDGDWKLVTEEKDPPLKLFRYHRGGGQVNRFKIVAELPNSAEMAYKFCTNVLARPQWDEMCVEAKLIAELDSTTKIYYTRSKGVFPVASRDLCNLFHTREIGGTGSGVGENGTAKKGKRYLAVARSVDHPDVASPSGVVRAWAHMIGTIISPHPTDPEKCILTQVNEIDPRGSVPSSVVKYVAGYAVPGGIKKLRKFVSEQN
ncbi:START domain-containing protein 10 [Quaeritorhiza haematococci]|nr:START domain-containing protein 10 [Quaeritorhiza haematococci]